ncbi:MAG: tetratricopeptide repeat protein [Chitinophagaceae bacterium]|nr:tetratricopeptide repeat protein [Chitinophagaceae bacterium]
MRDKPRRNPFKNNYMRKVSGVLMGLLCCGTALAQTRNSNVYAGNEAYRKGDFKQAEAQYRQAFSEKKLNEASYNLGNALYEQKNFTEAVKAYEQSAKQSLKPALRAKAHFNAGNVYLNEKQYEQAIEAYKQALRENPGMEDARYNLAYAKKRKQEQQEQEQKQDQPEKEKQKEKQKENEKQNQNESVENKQDQPEKEKQKENENESGEDKQPRPSKLNKNQADELLNALQREERKLREKKEKQKGHPVSPEKDW